MTSKIHLAADGLGRADLARTAGFLLSTAASDSEGTLGGLVALGETRYLTRLMNQAFDDPFC